MRRRKEESQAKKEPRLEVSDENVEDTSCSINTICKWTILAISMIYITIPLLLFLVPEITEQLVFLNLLIGKDEMQSLSKPATVYGLHGTGTFHVNCDDVKLGVWHILPRSRIDIYKDNAMPSDELLEEALRDAEEVIIYLHGNAMSRATGEGVHRAEFYKVLQNGGFHTIAFDYRGFGDSTGWPSEAALVRDFQCIAQWVSKKVSTTTRFITWGHSLGTAILSASMRSITRNCVSTPDNCLKIDGVILEGGFTNVTQGARDSPFAKLFKYIYPDFILETILAHAFSIKQISMANDQNVGEFNQPILILHAEDDDIIPFYHGLELFEIIKNSKHQSKHRLIQFKSSHKYSHNFLYKCDKLCTIVRDFIHSDKDGSNDVISV